MDIGTHYDEVTQYNGLETKMRYMNLIYNPEHQQILEHHKELLRRAEQEQLECSVVTASKHVLPSIRHFLRRVISDHHAKKMMPAHKVTLKSKSLVRH